MNPHYDIAIIGGGLSGLFLLYQLRKTLPTSRIALFERRSRVGGYAHHHRCAYSLENHPLVHHLVHQKSSLSTPLSIPFSSPYPPFELQEILPHSTLGVQGILGAEGAHLDWASLYASNPEDAYRWLLERPTHFIHSLEHLVQYLQHICRDSIHTGCSVTEFSYVDGQFLLDGGGQSVTTNQLILAVPPHSLRTLYPPLYPSYLEPVPGSRIRCQFPYTKKGAWYRGLAVTQTDGPLGLVIPTTKGGLITGIATGPETVPIYEANQEGRLEAFVWYHLKKAFPKRKIPKPKQVHLYYSDCLHYYRPPNVPPVELQPYREPLYIIGNSYSSHPSHLEGSLETASRVLVNILEGHGIEDETDELVGTAEEMTYTLPTQSSTTHPPILPLQLPDYLLTIYPHELKQHGTVRDAWIGLFGYVYDITSWIPDYKGPKKLLLKGLGRDWSATFKTIHYHYRYRDSIGVLLTERLIGKMYSAKKVV